MKIILNNPTVSTVAVMEWLRDNNCPSVRCQWFTFPNADTYSFNSLIVSDHPDLAVQCVLIEHPLDTWHEVFGMKRLCVGHMQWIACINDKYYFITD